MSELKFRSEGIGSTASRCTQFLGVGRIFGAYRETTEMP